MQKSIAGSFLLAMALLSTYVHAAATGKADQSVLQHCEVAEDVAIRFWYLPPDADLTPGPLIFLPVSSQDPRLDTRPAWVLYVSLADLHNVVRVLDRSHLEWKESSVPEKLIVDPLQLPQLDGHTMEIAVSYPNGSAITNVKTERVHPVIASVYCALVSAKARESMTVWSGNVDCVAKSYQTILPPK
jgi:hypothetical protein